MDPRDHSDDELLSVARRLIGAERKLTAKLVAYLAEIESRRLHLIAGYASMFDFCTRGFGLSENEAFRRIAVARLGRRFPIVHFLLASGAVNLTTLELLREHLTEENHHELLEAVSGRESIERARHFGRPKRQDPPSSDASRKLQTALSGLGFAPARARDAIAEVRRLHRTRLPSLEQMLREAILIATRSCEKRRRVA